MGESPPILQLILSASCRCCSMEKECPNHTMQHVLMKCKLDDYEIKGDEGDEGMAS